MSEASLNVELRDKTGHHGPKQLRKAGKIPGIFYMSGEESIPIKIDANTFNRLARQEINVWNVIFPGGKERKCIVREIQRHPVTDENIHMDDLIRHGISLNLSDNTFTLFPAGTYHIPDIDLLA